MWTKSQHDKDFMGPIYCRALVLNCNKVNDCIVHSCRLCHWNPLINGRQNNKASLKCALTVCAVTIFRTFSYLFSSVFISQSLHCLALLCWATLLINEKMYRRRCTDGAPWCLHMYIESRPFRWAVPEGITQAETHLLYNPKATVVLFWSLCVNTHLHMALL